MSDFKYIEGSGENLRKYWDGPSNMFARYYSYWQRGLGLVNEAKYYLIAIFGGTILSGFKPDLWMTITAAIIAPPVIIIAGRWDLYKLSKAREFINGQHGSVTGFNGYNMQVLNTALMEAIAEKMGVSVDKLKEDLK